MTLILETGVGVRSANSYVTTAIVTSYLTARNRQTENTWSTRTAAESDAACIAATDYVEKRFGGRFRGIPAVSLTETSATAEITFTGLPTAADTVTIGDETYTFVATLTGAVREVLVGATATECAENLRDALSGSRHVSAASAAGVVTLTALAPGSQGTLTTLSESLDNATITSAFSGGVDGGIQPLSWPRSHAYDDRGQLIEGVPELLRQAVSEYAVRAVSATLLSDPTVDPYAGSVSRRAERVGPIEESVQYDPGTVGARIFTPYPAADKILRPLLLGSRGVIRA